METISLWTQSSRLYSNTGLLAMTTFVYGILGAEGELTGAQVYQDEVEYSMRALEKNTYKYGRGPTALFDLMVEQGPGYVHAIAASKETTIRYNINRSDELCFPLAFIFRPEVPSGPITRTASWTNLVG